MEKKDIYEHLAKIYLENAPAYKGAKPKAEDYKIYIFVGIAVVIVVSSLFLIPFSRNPSNTQTMLILAPDPVKINYKFDPVKKEAYSFDLKRLNIAGYKSLAFSVKRSNFNDDVSIRVELQSIFKERSEVYVKNVPNKWKEYVLDLTQFKNITEWAAMSGLIFTVEEWNSRDDKGIVFIDNVRFIK
ncbi:MAG: hypothetical protein WC547_06620 [Candidatus Omnitrophota bacterium]